MNITYFDELITPLAARGYNYGLSGRSCPSKRKTTLKRSLDASKHNLKRRKWREREAEGVNIEAEAKTL